MVFLCILALASLAVGARSWFADPRQWSTLTGSLQALGGLSLVIVTLLYVRRVDEQAEASRQSAQAAAKTARASEHRMRILERKEQEETLSRLQKIKSNAGSIGVQCLYLQRQVDQRTMAGEADELPIEPPLIPEPEVQSLEAAGIRVGGSVAASVVDAVEAIEKAEEALRATYIVHHGESDDETAEMLEALKRAIGIVQTKSFEARSSADSRMTSVRDRLQDEFGPTDLEDAS